MTDHEDRYADALRTVLQAEAEQIVPAGDGLNRIRARVEERRSLWWFRPTLGLVGAAAVGGIAFLAISLAGGNGGSVTLNQHQHPGGPVGTPTSAPTIIPPTSAPAPQVVGVWPFETEADAESWQKASTGGQQPWHYDAGQTAVAFLAFLKHPEINQVMSTSAQGSETAVTLGQHNPDSGRTTKVTTVLLKQVGTGSPRPWDVEEATASQFTIDQPTRFAQVNPPVTVSGHITGVDESIVLNLISPSTGGKLNPSTQPVAAGGQNTAWHERLNFQLPPNDYVGALVATTGGHVAAVERLVMVPVTLLTSRSPQSAREHTEFVASYNNRIALVDSTTGAVGRYLTTPTGTFHDGGPVTSDDHSYVYFVRGESTCNGNVWRVPWSGGPAEGLTHLTAGSAAADTPAISPSGGLLGYVVRGCAGGEHIVLQYLTTGSTRSISVPNGAYVQSLAVSPQFGVAVAYRNASTQFGLHVLPLAATSITQGRTITPRTSDCSWWTPQFAANRLFLTEDCSTAKRTWSLDAATLSGLQQVGPPLPDGNELDRLAVDTQGHIAVWMPGRDTLGNISVLFNGQWTNVPLHGTCNSVNNIHTCPTSPDW